MGKDFREHLKIGQLAQLSGVTTRALRYYEALGLIAPDGRTAGKFRLYRREALDAVRSVLALKEAGLSLDHIAHLRALGRAVGRLPASEFLGRVARELSARRGEVRCRIEGLVRRLEQYEKACDVLEHCPGCGGKVFDGECLDCLAEKIPGFSAVLGGLLRV
ncbi:MAG: MerR family transcriptional regulator [Planctomycetota bacterium]